MQNFTIFLFLFFATTLFSQPVLDNSLSPEIGDTYTINYLDDIEFDPGPTGANVSWDYSNLPQDFEFHYSFIAPSEAPGFENFPDADCVWNLVEFESYNFYKKTDEAIVTLGGVNGNAQTINSLIIYQDENEAMNLPITFNTSYEYVSTYEEYLFGIFFGIQTRTSNLIADAYGTLKTPNGTFENVLRVKITYDDQFGFQYTQYAWFDTNDFIPLLQYEESSDPDITPYVVITKNDNSTTSVSKHELSSFNIRHIEGTSHYEQFFVESESSSKEVSLNIYDTQMQLVHHSTIDRLEEGDNILQVDIQLVPSLYIIELQGTNVRGAKQFYKK